MGEITYRALKADEFRNDMLADYRRHQVVKRIYVCEGDGWAIVDDDFIDDWSAENRIEIADSLRKSASTGGTVVGALDGERLIGFSSVGGARFGSAEQYVQMWQMHVSEEYRGKGIGKRLFHIACDAARAKGGTKLYISTQCSEETQGFYRGLGCVDALEINQAIAEEEPWDCQLEYTL